MYHFRPRLHTARVTLLMIEGTVTMRSKGWAFVLCLLWTLLLFALFYGALSLLCALIVVLVSPLAFAAAFPIGVGAALALGLIGSILR